MNKKFRNNTGKSRIIFPLDVSSVDEAKYFVRLLKDHVGLFKVGLELFIRSGAEIIHYIHSITDSEIFLDLKLHDIPETVFRAMKSVVALNVRFITVHCGENQEMLKSAVRGSEGKVDVLGVTVLTSISGHDLLVSGFKDEYASDIQKLVLHRTSLAKQAGCAGVICSGHEVSSIKQLAGNDFLAITPGIRLSSDTIKNDDQKRSMTPSQSIKNGADYLVIGRPIRYASNPVDVAKKIADEIEAALCEKLF